MISQQPLKIITPILFMLVCGSTISATAQSPSGGHRVESTANSVVFKDMSVITALSALAKQIHINVVFDDTVNVNDKLTIDLKDVSMEQALKIVFVAKTLQARIIEDHTILVFPDNMTNRHLYSEYEQWPVKGASAQSSSEKDDTTSNINLSEAPVKKTVTSVGEQLKLNVVFDDSVRDNERLTLNLDGLTPQQVMKVILIQKHLQARIIEEGSVIVFHDNVTNRQKYEQYGIWPAKADGSK